MYACEKDSGAGVTDEGKAYEQSLPKTSILSMNGFFGVGWKLVYVLSVVLGHTIVLLINKAHSLDKPISSSRGAVVICVNCDEYGPWTFSIYTTLTSKLSEPIISWPIKDSTKTQIVNLKAWTSIWKSKILNKWE